MSDMQWQTDIAEVTLDDVIIRGHRLSELVGEVTFVDMAFLLIRGDRPTEPQRRMLDAILVTLADHGISPTAIIARTLTSCGTPIQASMAGAMLSIGDHHGGSGEEVGRILAELQAAVRGDDRDGRPVSLEQACDEYVAARRAARSPIPGFGHPQHSGGDPRAIQLLGLAESLEVAGEQCATLTALGLALERATGRANLRAANVTGAVAAILVDLGFPWQSIRGIAITARGLGLTAHVVEELEQGNRWRHVPADQVQYTGPQPPAA